MFDVKKIQIWTFPPAPSTELVPSLAERVGYVRYSINLRSFNWRVPALVSMWVFGVSNMPQNLYFFFKNMPRYKSRKLSPKHQVSSSINLKWTITTKYQPVSPYTDYWPSAVKYQSGTKYGVGSQHTFSHFFQLLAYNLTIFDNTYRILMSRDKRESYCPQSFSGGGLYSK